MESGQTKRNTLDNQDPWLTVDDILRTQVKRLSALYLFHAQPGGFFYAHGRGVGTYSFRESMLPM